MAYGTERSGESSGITPLTLSLSTSSRFVFATVFFPLLVLGCFLTPLLLSLREIDDSSSDDNSGTAPVSTPPPPVRGDSARLDVDAVEVSPSAPVQANSASTRRDTRDTTRRNAPQRVTSTGGTDSTAAQG